MTKKKTTSTDSAEQSRETAAKSRKPPQSPASAIPLINTANAAANAARMLAARAKHPQPQATKPSGLLKQLKDTLNKPAATTVSNALGNTFGEHKSALPFPGGKQPVHNQNQTQGGVSRFSVPRRSNG